MAKQKTPRSSVIHYEARAGWDNGTLDEHLGTRIVKAVIREGAITLEWPLHDDEKAETYLTSDNGYHYSGYSVWSPATQRQQRSVVEAVLYSNKVGHVLVGQENWPSGLENWFIVQFSNGRAGASVDHGSELPRGEG